MEQQKLKKLICFCIENSINIFDFFTVEEGELRFKENLYLEVNKILREMQENKELSVEFTADGHNYILTPHAAIVDSNTVKEMQKFFSSNVLGVPGRTGNVVDVLKELRVFSAQNPEFSSEDYIYAAERYSRDNEGKKYALGIIKFIKNELYNYLTAEDESFMG